MTPMKEVFIICKMMEAEARAPAELAETVVAGEAFTGGEVDLLR